MKKEAFNVVGISVRTTNENGKSTKDILGLWGQFMNENLLEKIQNKIGFDVYCVYSDYDGSHLEPYTVTLGCRVSDTGSLPKELTHIKVNQGNYERFCARGDLTKGVVFDAWAKIWDKDIRRAFTTDYEVYGEKAQNPQDAEVEIFIATK